jgi:hypothetical protein
MLTRSSSSSSATTTAATTAASVGRAGGCSPSRASGSVARAGVRRRRGRLHDDDDDVTLKATFDDRRRLFTLATTTTAVAMTALASFPDAANAVSDAVGGFVVGGGAASGAFGAPDFASDEYAYRTPDLAVDLASPLVAYWCVTKALRQEIPAWLEGIIFIAALGATYVCVTDNHSLDSVLA